MAKTVTTHIGSIYPWHCDHMGHMNVMWYTGKFDEGTWAFFQKLGLTSDHLRDNNRGMAALEITTKYLKELLAGDQIEIHTHLIEVRRKVIRFEHQMFNMASGALCATSALTGAYLDTVARKAVEFPEDLHNGMAAWLEETS